MLLGQFLEFEEMSLGQSFAESEQLLSYFSDLQLVSEQREYLSDLKWEKRIKWRADIRRTSHTVWNQQILRATRA